MGTVLKVFLSLSFSGTLLILALFLGKRFLKNKISRQWQYYIWLIVILRLLLPFGPKTTLMGKSYQAIDKIVIQTASLSEHQTLFPSVPASILGQNIEKVNAPSETLILSHSLRDIISLFTRYVWLIWLLVATGMLIRKITIYQGFIQYINAGQIPVSDIRMLDSLSTVLKRVGVKKTVELCVNPLVSSPLLIGFFQPCIVLPNTDISETDFQYIVLHELMHYKRRDIFYKWLVQVTVCLHWFNPFVHLMAKEINRACEFSCDEAILAKAGYDGALDYGKTLLDAMAAIRKHKENPGVVSLSENKQLLKERLGAIMSFQKKSKSIRFLTGALTLCILFIAAFIGVYPVAAAGIAQEYVKVDEPEAQSPNTRISLDGENDKMDRKDWDLNFEQWDEEDWNWNEEDWDWDEEDWDWDEEDWNWDEEDWDWDSEDGYWDWTDEEGRALLDAYAAFGITTTGNLKDYTYYYQGNLVNILFDCRYDDSFYRLSKNPAGTINIKIIRNADNEITGVAYMTKAEVDKLQNDMMDFQLE